MNTAPALKADGTIAHTGRRTRLTYDAITTIAERVRKGQPLLDVIQAVCRVERATVTQWLHIGRGEHTQYANPPARYRDLLNAVEEAESAWIAETVGRWTDPALKPHYKLQLAAVSAKRPEYREQVVSTPSATPLQAITAHLVEVRRLIEARDAPVALKVIDVRARALPEIGEDDAGVS